MVVYDVNCTCPKCQNRVIRSQAPSAGMGKAWVGCEKCGYYFDAPAVPGSEDIR